MAAGIDGRHVATPTIIGPYRVHEPLGRGGMGIVYRATRAETNDTVALKTVHEATTDWFDGIRNEIRALHRIRHPGIVNMLDHGSHRGRPWYAMELIQGETLTAFCSRIWGRPSAAEFASTTVSREDPEIRGANPDSGVRLQVPEPEQYSQPTRAPDASERKQAMQIMRRVCATIAFMHGEGFVSCDIKPDNILIRNGSPVLIDFGLSASHPGLSGREAPHAHPRGGTLYYMAPEQLRGEFVDARCDLYSIGCILYELFTGAPPFVGPPARVIHGHLTRRPVEPGRLVSDVPKSLDQLIVRLLEKDPAQRCGYADEVAGVLGQLAEDSAQLAGFPAPRPYLYRPAFVDREQLVADLRSACDRLAAKKGAFVLLSGVSGSGKTRLAMEVTRAVDWSCCSVVITEVQPPVRDSTASVIGASPLAMLRPVLRAVADRCQQGGAEATSLLLGDSISLLSLYEPLLNDVPGGERGAPVPELPPEAARRRLFRQLERTLARMAADRPFFWLIDDIGWGDELSLAFLEQLPANFFEESGVLIVGTFRSDEPSKGLDLLKARDHVRTLEVDRLPEPAIASMAADMLAASASAAKLAPLLVRVTAGNPFFVSEYLRAAIQDSLLSRDEHGGWHLAEFVSNDAPRLAAPASLREVLSRRLDGLTSDAGRVVKATAVLGREADPSVIAEVAELGEDAAAVALDELRRRHILQPGDRGQVRFTHDQLRDAVDVEASPERGELHLRAAAALERRVAADPSHLVAIGNHFGAAGDCEKAAIYLERAATRARITHANADALRLFTEAVSEAEKRAVAAPTVAHWPRFIASMDESIGDLSSLAAQRSAARNAYAAALANIDPSEAIARARIQRKIGKTWEAEHQHDAALQCYDESLRSIGSNDGELEDIARDEWIQVHIERVWVHYWRGSLEEMEREVAALTPVVGRHGTPAQRMRFLQSAVQLSLRKNRYRVDESALAHAREACDIVRDRPELPEYPMAHFNLGFALLFNLALVPAQQALETALESARRGGDATHESRCLTYLSICARMLGKTAEAERCTAETERVSRASGMTEYLGVVLANRAWLAMEAGTHAAAARFAEDALERWRSVPVVYPFQWLALLPLLRVHADAEDVAKALECAQHLLEASQHDLPAAAADHLHRALRLGNADSVAVLRCIRDGLIDLANHGYR